MLCTHHALTPGHILTLAPRPSSFSLPSDAPPPFFASVLHCTGLLCADSHLDQSVYDGPKMPQVGAGAAAGAGAGAGAASLSLSTS